NFHSGSAVWPFRSLMEKKRASGHSASPVPFRLTGKNRPSGKCWTLSSMRLPRSRRGLASHRYETEKKMQTESAVGCHKNALRLLSGHPVYTCPRQMSCIGRIYPPDTDRCQED